MCVYVFGGASSSSCCNYALRKTDLLKSVNVHKVKSKHVDDVRLMCKAGGFHLAKFIYDDREVLATMPEEDRRQSVKKSRLDNTAFQQKELLEFIGIWNMIILDFVCT